MGAELPHENVLNQVANDVEVYFAKEEVISEFLNETYTRHVEGESIQDDLERFFDEESEFRRLIGAFMSNDEFDDLLGYCIEENKLSEDAVDKLRSNIVTHLWIAPALEAYERSQTDDIYTWTDGDATLLPGDEHDVIVEHQFDRGLDTLHEIRAPAGEFFQDASMRVHMVARLLDEMGQQGEYVNEELLEGVEEGAQAIHEVADNIDDIIAMHRDEDDGDGDGGVVPGDENDDNPGGPGMPIFD